MPFAAENLWDSNHKCLAVRNEHLSLSSTTDAGNDPPCCACWHVCTHFQMLIANPHNVMHQPPNSSSRSRCHKAIGHEQQYEPQQHSSAKPPPVPPALLLLAGRFARTQPTQQTCCGWRLLLQPLLRCCHCRRLPLLLLPDVTALSAAAPFLQAAKSSKMASTL
jgi:hypothetical protein